MPFDPKTLDSSMKALAAYDWSGDAAPLGAIDAAVVAAHDDAQLAADLEGRLAAMVASDASRAAKEYACRKLAMIGTTVSVPALAARLGDADDSHMARFALERMQIPEAAEALRQAVDSLTGDLRIGMLSSLAARRDTASVARCAALLAADAKTAVAAAGALGRIATPEAAKALATAHVASGPVAEAIVDARIACADAFLARGARDEARTIFEAIAAEAGEAPATRRARAVRIAARSGILAALDDTASR